MNNTKYSDQTCRALQFFAGDASARMQLQTVSICGNDHAPDWSDRLQSYVASKLAGALQRKQDFGRFEAVATTPQDLGLLVLLLAPGDVAGGAAPPHLRLWRLGDELQYETQFTGRASNVQNCSLHAFSGLAILTA